LLAAEQQLAATPSWSYAVEPLGCQLLVNYAFL